jgi:hypothetical protein
MTHFDPAKIASVVCRHPIVLMESIVLDERVAGPYKGEETKGRNSLEIRRDSPGRIRHTAEST